MDIKIGSKSTTFVTKHVNPHKTHQHTERLLKELSTFLAVSSDYVGVFSERVYLYFTVIKDLQGKIVATNTTQAQILNLVRSIKNSGEKVGEYRLRNLCERIERNINSNQEYAQDLHVLKQDLTQTIRKMNHLFK